MLSLLPYLIIGAWAALWVNVLAVRGQIFGFFPIWFSKIIMPDSCKEPRKFCRAVAKPLYICDACHAGWVAILYSIVGYCDYDSFFQNWKFAFSGVVVAMTTARFLGKYVWS
jgi:hypothetical protein